MFPVLMIVLCGCLPDPSGVATKDVVTDTSGFVVTDFDKPKVQSVADQESPSVSDDQISQSQEPESEQQSEPESPPAPVSEPSHPPESEAGVSENIPVPPLDESINADQGQVFNKPVVVCFTAVEGQICPGCIAAKQWHDKADKDGLPFVLQFKTDYPQWIESVPTFYWKGKVEWKKIEGWYGGEHLVKSWEGTQ